MSRPLYDALIAYSSKKKPFHMPGHKFGRYGDLNQINYNSLDATEASGLDNLYEAEGIIREAMKKMAEFYGALDTIFLTNGSTAGILASILAVCKPGDRLLVARNCHHSVWHGLILAGVTPIYISPEYNADNQVIVQMNATTIDEALRSYPDVKGALIVSPTYEGVVSDISQISEILHRENKVLIVDEAHGAHFPIHECFPTSSVELGADLVIQSMHKTLPNLTQSGLLHRCSSRITTEQLIIALKMVQTSSPSYMMMAMMDYVRDDLIRNKLSISKDYIEPLQEVRIRLEKMKNLRLLKIDGESDISKIVIVTEQTNIDGYELAEMLESQYQMVVEAALNHMIILMTTVADTRETIEELGEALIRIDSKLKSNVSDDRVIYDIISGEIISGSNPREIHFGEKEWLEISSVEGRTMARNIMLYPPGIPIVCLGEQLTQSKIGHIKKQQDRVLGIKIEANQLYVEVRKIN